MAEAWNCAACVLGEGPLVHVRLSKGDAAGDCLLNPVHAAAK